MAEQVENSVGQEQAMEFADDIRCRGYPHSGAIEAYGAVYVTDPNSDTEAWRVGDFHVKFDRSGVWVEEAVGSSGNTSKTVAKKQSAPPEGRAQ